MDRNVALENMTKILSIMEDQNVSTLKFERQYILEWFDRSLILLSTKDGLPFLRPEFVRVLHIAFKVKYEPYSLIITQKEKIKLSSENLIENVFGLNLD